MLAPEIVVRRRAIGLLDHYKRVEAAARSDCLWDRDASMVITTAVIRFALEVERQLGRLFVQLVLGNRALPGVTPRVTYRSAGVLSDHMQQGKPYLDWLPYKDQTAERACLFLRGGRPFTDMSSQGQKALTELSVIRNVLAHDSSHSRKKYERLVLSSRPVPSYERTIERYLGGRSTPTVTRLEMHLVACVLAFEELV